jgi:hypothetical protein
MPFFKKCQSIEEARKIFNTLLQENKPRIKGMKSRAINNIKTQYTIFLNRFMSNCFFTYYESKSWIPNEEDLTSLQEKLKKIINFECEIEIIGFWIYCFKAKALRKHLLKLGIWHSSTHKAYVFSGLAKKNVHSGKSLDEIRARLGSRQIK